MEVFLSEGEKALSLKPSVSFARKGPARWLKKLPKDVRTTRNNIVAPRVAPISVYNVASIEPKTRPPAIVKSEAAGNSSDVAVT